MDEQKKVEEIAWGKHIKKEPTKMEKLKNFGKNFKENVGKLADGANELGEKLIGKPEKEEKPKKEADKEKKDEVYEAMFGESPLADDLGF